MVFGMANCVGSALSNARICANVVDAGSVVAALGIGLAFAANARCERVSGVARWAGTDWALALCAIVSGCANGVGSARVGSTQVFRHELAAADERIYNNFSCEH